MFRSLRNIYTLLAKDWRSEIRSLQILPPAIVLALAAIVLFYFSKIDFSHSPTAWAAILWIVSLLALVVILDRALVTDTRNAVLEALLAGPVTPNQFLFAKLLFTGSMLMGLQVIVLLSLTQMMNLTISSPMGSIFLTLTLTDLGLIAMGLLCSLIAQFSRHRGAFLAGFLWPVALPLVLLAMMAIDDPARSENIWLILAGFDIVLLGISPGLLKVIAGK
jgi:ABC-type transport system involved in cytochrome c biogenesis permease component